MAAADVVAATRDGPRRLAVELAWRPGIAGPVDGTAGICRVCLFRKPHPTASGKGRYEHVSSRKPKTRAVRSTRDAAGSETGTGRRRRLATTGPLAHLSEVPRQEINKLVGGAAEVRSLVHDDPIRCRNASVRRMRAYRIVPRRDRTTVLSSEPRSRPGPCLCLHDPCSARRDGQRTRGQHGSAIRIAHVRPQSTQPNVGPPRCALPGYPTRSMLAVGPAHSGDFAPHASRARMSANRSATAARCALVVAVRSASNAASTRT